MPALLLRTYHGSKTLQFDTESTFLSKIHISFYCGGPDMRRAGYEDRGPGAGGRIAQRPYCEQKWNKS